MCLAIPMQIEKLEHDTATVSACGSNQSVSIVFTPSVKVGDYVLVHAGFAIKQIDETEAKKTIDLLNEIAERERSTKR